jgi:hypothetical protein
MSKLGSISVNEIEIAEVDASPIGDATLDLPTGSIAILTDGTQMWHKNSVGINGWQPIGDKAYVGLPNVDNTSDANKPVSTQVQTALNLKYDSSNPSGYETATQLNTRDTNNRNRSNHTGSQLSSTISDFNEATQDAVGTILTDTASLNLTYNDVANTITADVLPAGVNHNALQNYVANEHINHTSVVLTANNGLTGGGDISASRTISMQFPETVNRVTAIQSTTSTTYANITQMVTTSLDIGTYELRLISIGQSTAVGTGIGLRLAAGTAVIGTLCINWNFSQAGNGTDKNFEYTQNSVADNITSASVATANVNYPMSGNGLFTVTTAGTVAIQIRSETNGTNVSIRPESFLFLKKVA